MNVQMYINITVRLIGPINFSDCIKHSFDDIGKEYWLSFEKQI